MIKIVCENNKIRLTGHAGGEYGKDIVCASVSSIVYTTVNAILNIDSSAIKVVDENDIFEINILNEDEIVRKLINNMMVLCEQLEKQYPQKIKLSKGEL